LRNISIIKWGNNRYNESYLFGSEVFTDKEKTHFSSPMMSVGGKIKTWYSHSLYTESRVSPMLPLLVRGNAYKVALFLEENRQNKFQVTVECYDKFNQEISTQYFDDFVFVFTYPQEAVSYKINLINNKHELLIFYLMLITEVSSEITEVSSDESEETCDMLKQEGFYLLKNNKGMKNRDKNELEIVINYLVRETSVLEVRDAAADSRHFFVSEAETSFLKTSVEIIKTIRETEGAVSLLQGINFAQLPDFYRLLPSILHILLPDREFSTTITLHHEAQREIQKYVWVLRQMLAREYD
jgi:accessory secretory protein Asp3